MYDFPFHMFYILYAFAIVGCRSYYIGFADASGERVKREEEGAAILSLRYFLGVPFLIGALVYLINPNLMGWSTLSDQPIFLRWIGISMLIASLLLYRWTHEHLGKNFTDTVYVRAGHTLVKDGPYRWVRHPMYVSLMLGSLGTGFALANWFLGVIGTLGMIVIMGWRTPIEEMKLQERHGEEYRRYMQKTGRYFPKLF